MGLFDEEVFDRFGLDEDALFERMDVLGKGLCCDFGSGRQGIAYLTEDNRFVKITVSSREAAFAQYLLENPRPGFPDIDGVFHFELQGRQFFAIYREDVADVFGFDDIEDTDKIETFKMAWSELVHLWPPKHHSDHVKKLREAYPDLFGELYAFLGKLQDLKDFEEVEVYDFHADNAGRTEQGIMVVRDFGMNTLSQEVADDMISRIDELPQPFQALVA